MLLLYLSLLDTADEKEKFTRLFNTYKTLLYWLALQRTHNEQDAEDCVQETFLYVAAHFEKIGEVDSPRTKGYLSTVVTGFAIDMFHAAERREVAMEEYEFPATDDGFEDVDAMELSYLVDTVLDEKSRLLMYLKHVYGYKSKEIAELYHVSDTSVRKRLQYAKAKLKGALIDSEEHSRT